MGRLEFEEMLDKTKKVDWARRHETWQSEVRRFFAQIDEWLQPFSDKKKLVSLPMTVLVNGDDTIEENPLEAYTIEGRRISFGEEIVRIVPVGTEIIGAKGRIDMKSTRGVVKFLLVGKDHQSVVEANENKESQQEWKILLSQSDGFAFEELTEEAFFDALMEIVRG